MVLAGNDLVQMAEIKKLNVEQYLILLARKMKEREQKEQENG